jgi:hypothetical protein
MKSKKLNILAAALILAMTAPTLEAQTALRQSAPRQPQGQAQAQPRQQPRQQNQVTEVIALQTYVEGRSETYGVKPAQAIPVRAGERVRINLVGTAIVNGNGEERPVNARFSVAAGRDQLDIVRSGPNWVDVQVGSRKDDGIAQLAYEVTSNYEMKGGLKSGRITFQIGEGTSSSPGSVGSGYGVNDRDRWNRAQELTAQLYRSILGTEPRGDLAREDAEYIYDMGAVGVRDVALALADDADGEYDRLSEDEAVEVLGDLYRGLLRRSGSDSQLWDQDSGFRNNVNTLRRQGYEKMIQVILDAPEFRTANDLQSFGSLSGRDSTDDWRRDRGRYAVRQN